MIKALGNNIIIKPNPFEEKPLGSSIIRPQSSEQRQPVRRGIVVSVGTEYKGNNDLKVEDEVIFLYKGPPTKWGEYLVVKEDFVLGILEK